MGSFSILAFGGGGGGGSTFLFNIFRTDLKEMKDESDKLENKLEYKDKFNSIDEKFNMTSSTPLRKGSTISSTLWRKMSRDTSEF